MTDAERVVHARVPYVTDKEVHVSTVQSPQDGKFVDVREYIPSLEEYGRGITVPLRLLHEVLQGLESAWHENGAGEWADADKGVPGG